MASTCWEAFEVKRLPPKTQKLTQATDLAVRSMTYTSGHETEFGFDYRNDSVPNWQEKVAMQQDVPQSHNSSPSPPQFNSWLSLSSVLISLPMLATRSFILKLSKYTHWVVPEFSISWCSGCILSSGSCISSCIKQDCFCNHTMKSFSLHANTRWIMTEI